MEKFIFVLLFVVSYWRKLTVNFRKLACGFILFCNKLQDLMMARGGMEMRFIDFSAAQVRIARPTDKFTEVIKFYEQGLGLERLTEFSGHKGYDGVILGLPNAQYHLEFTSHEEGSPCPAPTKDNLLVFYIPDKNQLDHVAARLKRLGYGRVAPENEYWNEKGITIEDPDGWRIVLMNTKGI